MRRVYIFPVIIILLSVLAGCNSTAQPAEITAMEESAAPGEPVPSRAVSTNPYLNCLSPAFEMNDVRAAHTAILLPDGRVLIAGGFHEEGTSEIAIASAELFDPETNTFTPTGDMNVPRDGHTATLLPDGQVLIAGGWSQNGRTSTAELYDPQTGTFE